MNDIVALTVEGLSLGSIYALIALGFVVIYRSSQIFNFAHGELVAIGAFTMSSMLGFGLPWPLAFVACMVITGAVAAGVERVVIRPMIGRPVFVTIILTLFVALLLHALTLIIWKTPRRIPTPWAPEGSATNIDLLPTEGLYNDIASVTAGMLALAAFFYLIRYTKLGIGMRATNYDQETALALGIPVGRIFASTWFLAGVFAAIAGVFLSIYPNAADHNIGFVAMRAFPAVIVGGLTSPVGAAIAGVLLGLLEAFGKAYLEKPLGEFGNNISTVIPYVAMMLVLVVKPYGLFGTKDVERV